MRVLASEEYALLEMAVRRLVKGCGGVEAAASLTRVGKSSIGRYQERGTGECMPIDVVADLEREAGMVPVTQALARLSGRVLLALPDAAANPAIAAKLAALGKEIAEVFSAGAAALADNRIAPEERRVLLDEIDGAALALAELRASLLPPRAAEERR